MTQKELETIATKEFTEFLACLSLLNASQLARLELYLYRDGRPGRAVRALQAGLINCGDEYYDY